jgi:4-carboxymuconolactone decarboxylase
VGKELFDQGLKIRKEVVGEEYVERAFEAAGDYGREFQELLTTYCWGAAWGGDALTRRERSLLNIGIIGTLGRTSELRLHLRGALRNGVTSEEIRDAIIQLTVYAGVPLGLEAMKLAQEVVAEHVAAGS